MIDCRFSIDDMWIYFLSIVLLLISFNCKVTCANGFLISCAIELASACELFIFNFSSNNMLNSIK